MKKILLSLLVLISLVFTFVSCEAEADISTPPQALNDTDERTLDLFLDDLLTEAKKPSSEETPLKSDLMDLLEDALEALIYSNASFTSDDQTISFAYTVTKDANTNTEKVDVLITMKNFEPMVTDSNGASHIITGTIKGSIKDNSGLNSAGFVDSANFNVTWIKDGIEQTPVSVNITEDKKDTYFTINDKEYTLTTYYNTLLNNNDYISYCYELALLNKIKNEGISFESDIAKAYYKGELQLSYSATYIYFNPITIELKRPILINDKEYSGNLELKALVLTGGSDQYLIDLSLSFNLERKDGEVKNKYSGTIDFVGNTVTSSPSSSTPSLDITVKSFSINEKPIVTNDIYKHIIDYSTNRK